MIRRPPRSTLSSSSAASDVYKRQLSDRVLRVRGGDAWLLRHPTLALEPVVPAEEPDVRSLYRNALQYTVSGDSESLSTCVSSLCLDTTWERSRHDYADTRNGLTEGTASLVRAPYDRPRAVAPSVYHTIKFGAFEISWDSEQMVPSIVTLLSDVVEGDTLLHIACRRGLKQVAAQLVKAGADPCIPNALGETATDVAMSDQEHQEMTSDEQERSTRLSQFDQVASRAVEAIGAGSDEVGQLLQILVEILGKLRKVKAPEVNILEKRLDRLMAASTASRRSKIHCDPPAEDPSDELREEQELDGTLVSPIILYRYLGKLFSMADVDGSGDLDKCTVVTLMHSAKLSFSDKQILCCIDAYGQNGRINYREFIPVVIGVMHGATTDQNSEFPALYALTDRLIQRYLTQLFKFKSCDGALARSELRELLQLCSLHIEPSLLDLLEVIADSTGDGVVDTEAFIILLLFVVHGMRATVSAPLESAPESVDQVALLDEHALARSTLRQGSAAWEVVGDISDSAQLSLLHSSLLEQDGQLLGVKGPAPATRREDDVDTLTAQAACLTERRTVRDCAKEIFSILDKNLDGRLTCDECCKVLGLKLGTRLYNETSSGEGSKLAHGLLSLEGVEPMEHTVSFCDWLGYFETQAKRAAQNGVKDERNYLHNVAVYVSAMRDRLRAAASEAM
eukprot:TRINITY_DN19716_c0_g1_i1.p1 TRINITY_DN19716_c0_g1~~TRINITY_DN19716_c0_g1_i1.p1  ORF type:complete len:680 (+),score=155.25 TRINITY_DN19716_c0_g1_i1:88-2127(+)